MPVDSARSIRDVIEIVNQLWGSRTRGGRLYPAPIRRAIVVIGWDASRHLTWFELPALENAQLTETTFIAVKAVADDDVRFYDSLRERTAYPVDFLWGPGDERELRDWAATAADHEDEVDYLDRLFLVRVTRDGAEQPMRPSVAAGLPSPERMGHWHLVRADHPGDALGHVRSFTDASSQRTRCKRVGPCPNCAVEVLRTGHLDSMIHWLRESGYPVVAERPRRVTVPALF